MKIYPSSSTNAPVAVEGKSASMIFARWVLVIVTPVPFAVALAVISREDAPEFKDRILVLAGIPVPVISCPMYRPEKLDTFERVASLEVVSAVNVVASLNASLGTYHPVPPSAEISQYVDPDKLTSVMYFASPVATLSCSPATGRTYVHRHGPGVVKGGHELVLRP